MPVLSMPVMSVNDLRREQDLPPVPGGDTCVPDGSTRLSSLFDALGITDKDVERLEAHEISADYLPRGERNRRLRRRDDLDRLRRPEQNVLDAIEELVNDQLQHEASGYDHNINQDRCELCGGQWHGLTGTGSGDHGTDPVTAHGCPGAFATDDEIRAWQARRH